MKQLRKKIFHVEDDPSQRELVRLILQDEPSWELISCIDGAEALEKLAHQHPALVITDIRMPKLDGITLCRQLKQTSATATIPVLMLTQYSDPDTVLRALAAGADNFLEKPFDQGLLMARVQELLAQESHPASEQIITTSEGKPCVIDADQHRIFNFFFSAYKAAVHARDELRRTNDLLEQRVAERTIELSKRTEEAQKSQAELEQINYLVSHHLQDPLLRMVGFFELIERQCRGKIGSTTDRAFGELSAGIQKMQTLVSDLLLYSEKSADELPVVEADIQELTQEVLAADLERQIQLLDASIDVGALPRIRVNPWQIKQVLFNLLQNALKFHGPKRPQIKVSAEELADEWKFSVQDNGIGINPVFFDSIFYISPRLHSSTSFLGSGVGLAICRKIIERHQGRIWVQSAEGTGSAFHFTIAKSLGVKRRNGASLIAKAL